MASASTEDEAPHALQEVRRAYRYVAAYQQRIVDLVRSVETVLNGEGMKRWPKAQFCAGGHRASELPRHVAEGNAWAYLPLSSFELTWGTDRSDVSGSRWCVFEHAADYQLEQGGSRLAADPLPGSPETGVSLVRLVVVRVGEPFGGAWNLDWKPCLEEHFGRGSEAWPELEKPDVDVRRNGTIVVGTAINLADLRTPADTELKVLQPLRKMLESIREPGVA